MRSMPILRAPTRRHWIDLCGYGRLAAAGVVAAADAAESLHHAITRIAPPLGRPPAGRLGGIPRLVYGSVRGVARLVDRGLEAAGAAMGPTPPDAASTPSQEAWRAAVNGVFGDRLEAAGNPLAITMQLRRGGQPLMPTRAALAAALPRANGRVLVMLHGLCRNDLQWRHEGHDHGEALARDHGYTPLYLHYNSGRSIAANGAEFADLLEALLRAWPAPLQDLTLIGHSMGGLVARNAVTVAHQAGLPWLGLLRRLVFLGTPHRGARWEQLGAAAESALSLSPYSAPFARVGAARSAGITDLRHGDATPLPAGIDGHAIGATLGKRARSLHDQIVGDGLVPLDSALGAGGDGTHDGSLQFAPQRRWIARGTSHIGLLSAEDVYAKLSEWLAKPPAVRAVRRRQAQ